MALNDVKYLRAEFKRENIEETLIGLGQSINEYVSNPISTVASLDDFFRTFFEGNRTISPTTFFVQTRLQKGRVGIGYTFTSSEVDKGELKFSVLDNGENIPEKQLNAVYDALRQYVCQKKLMIIDEGVRSEY